MVIEIKTSDEVRDFKLLFLGIFWMTKYKYYMTAGPYGGEHTIGTIPKRVAEYWLNKGADAFDQYMLDDNHDQFNESGKIPKEYQLPTWYKLDNVDHLSAAVLCNSNTLTVLDVSNLSEHAFLREGKEIASIEMTNNLIGNLDVNTVELLNGEYIVYGASNDSGICRFELLETGEKFDESKLKFNVTAWNDFKLVTGINYKGQILDNEGMKDSTVQSMECWIYNL